MSKHNRNADANATATISENENAAPTNAPVPRVVVIRADENNAPVVIKTFSNDDVREMCAGLALEGGDAATIKERAFKATALYDATVIKEINDNAAAVRELNKATNAMINANAAISPFATARAEAAANVKTAGKNYRAAIMNAPVGVKKLEAEKRARNLAAYNEGVKKVSAALNLNTTMAKISFARR
jgi:hypothetical protein